MEINKVYCGDNVTLIKELPDNFIDLTVTSPPYDNLREYDGYLQFDFETLAKELYRVTKEGGVVVWVVGDQIIDGSESGTSFRQALYFKDNCGFKLHDTMIYQKNGSRYPESNRYDQEFEYMFVFSKGLVKTFNPIKIPKKVVKRTAWHIRQRDGNIEKQIPSTTEYRISYYNHGNIWKYNAGWKKSTKEDFVFEHPAIFPELLAKNHILSWSNKGDLVFDPFAGSGTTLKMAKMLERNYLGFEINPRYVKLIKRRLEQTYLHEYLPKNDNKTKGLEQYSNKI